jgi:hypothetical protein
VPEAAKTRCCPILERCQKWLINRVFWQNACNSGLFMPTVPEGKGGLEKIISKIIFELLNGPEGKGGLEKIILQNSYQPLPLPTWMFRHGIRTSMDVIHFFGFFCFAIKKNLKKFQIFSGILPIKKFKKNWSIDTNSGG